MNNGMTVLIDPILEGPLDFGIPDIFTGTKRILPTTGLTELLPLQHIDCLLLTQGLDDHAHVQTLTKLRNCDEFSNDTPIVAPLSAKSALEASGWYGTTNNIRFIEHGQETQIVPQQQQQQQQQGAARTSRHHTTPLSIRATIGALVGPPWQKRENGYLLTCASSSSSSSSSDNTDTTPTTTTIAKNNNSNKRKNPTVSLYIEPHVEFDPNELSRYAPVDVVITPTTGQTLPGFELVHGPKDSVHLIDTLQPRFVVPMPNADIDTSGWAAPLVRTVGSPTDFERGVANNGSRKRRGSDRSTTPTIVSVEAGRDVVIEL
ncbi:beta-lactamase-like protein [Nitzschia inconspicua]|nr:beta-lactamase-like protein [Nitzschia inconspicua]